MPPRTINQSTAAPAAPDAIPHLPAMATQAGITETRTPPQSPSKRAATGITQAQKQALVDNLQLEITERARKLRAQYALQAQGLRARLEMRVNRIPQGLRKRKMQDLWDEHAERENPKPMAMPVHKDGEVNEVVRRSGVKRQSDQISTDGLDKENMPSASQDGQTDLANPKKRAKTAASTATKAINKTSRTASKKAVPSTVLSPKSHNSRTLPRSPFKTSPEKPSSIRPPSPVKAPAAATGGKRAPSRAQGTKRTGTTNARSHENDSGRSSEASNTSAGTTIVTSSAATKKGGVGKAKSAIAGAKKAIPAAAKAASGVARKGTKKEKENAPPTATAATGRALRKRG